MILLTYYCLAILVVSVLGGMLPEWLRLTHRWMECAVSFVAGVMLGVAVLHLLPHALQAIAGGDASSPQRFLPAGLWLLAGFLGMFFVERFFCFHHHDVPQEGTGDRGRGAGDEAAGEAFACHDHDHAHSDHAHDLTWSGAALGLTLHSVMAGVALAASVRHGGSAGSWAGLGTFLAIVLHKPFDSMTIAMLMAKGGRSPGARAVVNALFSLAIPAGVLLAHLGISAEEPNSAAVGYALAFSAGVFLCISMSDLLPELQFHHHDRIKLSVALLLGLLVAYVAGQFETHTHAAAPGVEQVQGIMESPQAE